MKLNVGCGTAKSDADVNCDLFIHDVGHRGGDSINPSITQNFVLCDAQYLPFQSSIFDQVFCFHVIEHVPKPEMLFNELLRVSCDEVLIRCPHINGSGAHLPSHVNFFGFEWFHDICNKYQLPCHTRVRSYDSVLPKQSRKFIPIQLKHNSVIRAYLRFARRWFNPNHAVPQQSRSPFEIEVLVNARH